MIDFLNSLIDKLWLRPISLPFLYIFSVFGALGYAPDPPDPFTWKTYIFWVIFLAIDIIYTILVIKNNSLPRAKDPLSSVLFIIDAECDQFFSDIEKKLVSEFADCTADSNGKSYSALCVNQKRLRHFDFWNEEFMLKLLNKTNCMFVVLVRHRVDSVNNAENFMMHINYGIMHPTLGDNLHELLKLDMRILSNQLQTRKYCKAEIIDEMIYSATSLSITCQYLIGLVFLLSGRLLDAHTRFSILRNQIKSTRPSCVVTGFEDILDNRLFVTCKAMLIKDFDAFYLDENEGVLKDINSKLEEINSIIPNTYDYYLEKAFFHVAYNANIPAARECIKTCKQYKGQNSWRYSDAFLTAYEKRSPLLIYRKYATAFKYEQDLNRIVYYIEYMLDKEPERIGLHLAAGLVYHEIDEKQLSTEHLQQYLSECWNDGLFRILTEKGILINEAA